MGEDKNICPDCDIREKVMAHIKNRGIVIISPRLFLIRKITYQFIWLVVALVAVFLILEII